MNRPGLKAALSLALGGKPTEVEIVDVVQPPARDRAHVRIGRRQIAGWFPPEVAKQLHMIAVEEDTTLQALMKEAFNEVFTKRGKPPIA